MSGIEMYESHSKGRGTGDSSNCLSQQPGEEIASDKKETLSGEIGCGLIEALEDSRKTSVEWDHYHSQNS